MTFKEAVATCFNKYASFSGRAPRSEYWWFYLFLFLGNVVSTTLDTLLIDGGPDSGGPITSLFTLVCVVPALAVTARRLHDVDRSGWWQAAPAGLGIVGVLTSLAGALILSMAALLAAVIITFLLLFWLIQKGSTGPNRFGPDPLDGSNPHDGKADYSPSIIPRVPNDRHL